MDELQNIQDLIYVIRGQRVMLDFDLARLYEVETAQLKRQVRRNIERFEGEDFMFELSHEELLRCQIGTSSWRYIHSKSPKKRIQNLQKTGMGVSRNLTGSFSVRNHPFPYD